MSNHTLAERTSPGASIRVSRTPAVLMLLGCFLLGAADPALAKSKAATGGDSPKTKMAWTFDLSSNFAGALKSELAEDAFHVRFDKLDMTCIMHAPDWTAYLYSDSNHAYTSLPYEQWKKRFMFGRLKAADSAAKELKPVLTGKSKMILGHKAFQCFVQKADPLHKGKFYNQAEVWVTKDIKAPPQFGQLLTSMLSVPSDAGLPLKVLNRQSSGQMVSIMEAYKIDHGPVPASDFVPLTGYRKVKDEMALMMDEGDEKMVDDLAGGSPTSPAGSPGSKSSTIKGLEKVLSKTSTGR